MKNFCIYCDHKLKFDYNSVLDYYLCKECHSVFAFNEQDELKYWSIIIGDHYFEGDWNYNKVEIYSRISLGEGSVYSGKYISINSKEDIKRYFNKFVKLRNFK